ncbi:MAG: MATE family efflux transporter [Clostridiales bacterium]|nr:MATE family efflux transporter [Clostridiales bacterium]
MRFTTKDILKIIVPIVLEQLLAITVGMFDSIMVSSQGESAVSGVSLVDSVNVFLTMFFFSLSAGGAIVLSQLLGKKDTQTANEASKQIIYITVIIALVIGILVVFLRAPLLNLIFGKVESSVMENAKIYFLLTGISYPFVAIMGSTNAIFRAQKKSNITLYSSIVSNVINIAGNALLIYGFGMGVLGAGIATLFSRVVTAVLTLILVCNKKKNLIYVDKLFRFRFNKNLIKRICGIGIPNGLENSFFQLGKLLVSSLISGFGTASIAANAVAQTLTNFHFTTGTAINTGLTTVVGICIGAGEKEQAKKYTKHITLMVYIAYFAFSIIFASTVDLFSSVYNLSSQASIICKNIIYFNCITATVIWPLSFTLPSAFRAASDVKFTMIISIASMWVFRVAGSYFIHYVFGLGVYSVWIAMVVDWIFRAIIFVPRFIKGTWLTKYKH